MACVRLCPEIFLVNGDGYSYTKEDEQVAAELADLVRQAARACPVGAIVITEEA